jgi:hypothetical protein
MLLKVFIFDRKKHDQKIYKGFQGGSEKPSLNRIIIDYHNFTVLLTLKSKK